MRPRILILCVLVLFSFISLLRGNSDSLNLLPTLMPIEVEPVSKYTLAGKHPSEYEFAIEAPTPTEIEAWMKGDFEMLEGIIEEVENNGSKGELFGDVQSAIGKARGVIQEIENIGNFITKFNGSSLIKLPVGLKSKKDDGTEFIVGIDRVTLYPDHANLSVFAKVQTPDMERPLYFGAPDIKFTREGGVQAGSLGLLGNFIIPILEGKAELEFVGAEVNENEFVNGKGTYVKFDCDGLQAFNMELSIAFSRDVIIPVSEVGQPVDGKVKAKVELGVGNDSSDGLNDIIATVDLSGKPFAHPKKDDIIWKVGQIAFDFSETRHAGFDFPVAEYEPVLPDETLWKGVYISELEIQLPDQFGEGTNVDQALSIGVKSVVIDHNGFTGLVELSNLLSFEEGNMDGWPFSIDLFRLHFYRNSLAALTFEGLVDIPLFSSEEVVSPSSQGEGLAYLADFDIKDQQYLFKVNTTEDITRYSKMLKAEFTLKASSSLEVVFSSAEGFDVTATLHGALKVDADYGKLALKIPDIEFETVQITNKAPYVANGGTWKLDGELGVDFGGFKLTVKAPTFEKGEEEGEVQLKFFGSLNLDFGKELDISSEAAFRVIGVVEANGEERQNWRYEKLKVDMIRVEADKPGAFHFNGWIVFFDDLQSGENNFGSGFQGVLDLSIEKINLDVKALALFGNTGDYKYYFVDAMVKANIPIGTLALKGFGGGIYNNMAQGSVTEDFSGSPPEVSVPDDPQSQQDAYEELLLEWVGKSFSGTSYSPVEGTFGLNAGVILASAQNEEAFNVNVNLNLEFNKANVDGSGGGLAHFKLSGYANVMAPISWTGPSCTGVSIAVNMEYDNSNNSFFASADAFVNVGGVLVGNSTSAAPSSTIQSFYKGSTCDGLSYAGSANILFSEDEWYIWIGAPDASVFNNDVAQSPPKNGYPGPIALKLAIPGLSVGVSSYFDIGTRIPPFPGLPRKVEDLTGLGNLLQNESQRASGGGFMFGAGFNISNELDAFGIFKAGLDLDVGFDVQVRKFGGVSCVGSGDLGINGWYGAGQAWAYVEGYIKVARFTIFQLAVGAALQLKGPNPTYGRGAVGGRYKLLGGLIKGNCRFPVTFGKQCEVEGGGELEIEYDIIADISPSDQGEQVPIETVPSVIFSYPVNQQIEIINSEGEPTKWIIKVDHAKLTQGGTEVAITQEWLTGDQILDVPPVDFLKSETEYIVEVQASLYESDENGNPIGNATHVETQSNTFTTGPALDYIPEANIIAAYPNNSQFNYYSGESSGSYLILGRGQDELLEGATLKAIIDTDGESHEATLAYNSSENRLDYTMPGLSPGGAYQLKVVDTENEERPIYTMFFRNSHYSTFSAKMQAASVQPIVQEDVSDEIRGEYVADISGLVEPFGREEILGSAIDRIADIGSTSWMDNFTQASSNGVTINLYDCSAMDEANSWSGRTILGDRYPDKAVDIFQEGAANCIVNAGNYQDLHANRGNSNPVAGVGTPKILYFVPSIVKSDLGRMQTKLYYGADQLYKSIERIFRNYGFNQCQEICWDEGDDEPIRQIAYNGKGIENTFSAPFNEEEPESKPIVCDNNELRECCNDVNSGLKEILQQEVSQIFQNADNCIKVALEPYNGNICDVIHQPLRRRELFVEPNTSSDYPVKMNYILPDGGAGSNSTVNLKFSVQ